MTNTQSFPLFSDLRLTLKTWRAILGAALKNLSLVDNFGGKLVKDVSVPAGTEVSVRHDLGRIPKYVILAKQRGGAIENGDTADNKTLVYLKNRASTTTGVVDVLIIP